MQTAMVHNKDMDNAIAAMNAVNETLAAGDITGAQSLVMVIESTGSVLPSSYFESVLRAALADGCLTVEYHDWCERAYGPKQFAAMVAF